jgi:hypothetical protein
LRGGQQAKEGSKRQKVEIGEHRKGRKGRKQKTETRDHLNEEEGEVRRSRFRQAGKHAGRQAGRQAGYGIDKEDPGRDCPKRWSMR